jgi:metal-responsive CopG/Arc/MetJ family transcriptional regulator
MTVRLDKELAGELDAEARKSGRSKGEIVRQALLTRLGQNGKLSLMRRYFGVMEGPPDLSTNKTYRRTGNRILTCRNKPPVC